MLLHHVFVDEVEPFRRMLESLRLTHTFIDYSEAVTRILEDRVDDNYVTISFDDGLQCCRQAAKVLEEFGARACFFVCPPLVGETNPDIITRFCRERLHYPPVEFLDWNDVERLVDRGHEIGGHTMQHVNLNRVDSNTAQDEIWQTHATLRARLGEATHFAWPYGRFVDIYRAAIQAVFDAGFRSCASGVRGCHGPAQLPLNAATFSPEQLCLRRESIVAGWPQSHVNFFLRKSALRPLTIDQTWPVALRPVSPPFPKIPCALPSTRFPSNPAAA
ncbi:MAG: polysaccharide deacetylase family protein [Pirellulales bacterium]